MVESGPEIWQISCQMSQGPMVLFLVEPMNATDAGCLEYASQSNDAGPPVPVDPLTPVDLQISALDPKPQPDPTTVQHLQ